MGGASLPRAQDSKVNTLLSSLNTAHSPCDDQRKPLSIHVSLWQPLLSWLGFKVVSCLCFLSCTQFPSSVRTCVQPYFLSTQPKVGTQWKQDKQTTLPSIFSQIQSNQSHNMYI